MEFLKSGFAPTLFGIRSEYVKIWSVVAVELFLWYGISMVIYALEPISVIRFLSVILESLCRRRFLTDRSSHSSICKMTYSKRWLLKCIIVSEILLGCKKYSNSVRVFSNHIFMGPERFRIGLSAKLL
jgi:hypothetical protein